MDVRFGRSHVLALCVLFLCLAWLIHGTGLVYLRDDELIALRTTSRDLGYTLWYQAEQDVQAPLWFGLFWMWRQAAGEGEFIWRLSSALLSLLTLALTYAIGRRWFGGARYGLFSMAVLGANAYFFIYALEIRPYALVMLLGAASMYAFEGWLSHRTWKWALAYGVSLVAMLYVHYFLAFLMVVQGVYLVMQRPNRQMLKQLAGALGLAAVMWLPWTPVFIQQVQTLVRLESSFGNARGAAGIGSTTEPTSLEAVSRLAQVATNGQMGLYVLVLLVGVGLLWRKKARYRLALWWGLGVPAVAMIVNLAAAVYTRRYISYLVVGLALTLGTALAAVPSRWRWLALVGFVGISLWAVPGQLPPDRIPYRDLIQEMAVSMKPGDTIYIDHVDRRDEVFQYEMGLRVSPNWVSQAVTRFDDAVSARRVWHLTNRWFDDAVQANFRRLETSHPVQHVLGKCDRGWCFLIQLMEGAPLEQPIWFGNEMAFWGAEPELSEDRARLSVRLWWQVEQPPTTDYSISLQLLDQDGALVSQVDGSINDQYSGVVATSQLQRGRLYIDRRELAIPQPYRPGDYRLAVIVYNWQSGERLRLADGRDGLLLDEVKLA